MSQLQPLRFRAPIAPVRGAISHTHWYAADPARLLPVQASSDAWFDPFGDAAQALPRAYLDGFAAASRLLDQHAPLRRTPHCCPMWPSRTPPGHVLEGFLGTYSLLPLRVLWLGSVAGLCVPPLVLLLAARGSCPSTLCRWALCPGRVLLLSSSWLRP